MYAACGIHPSEVFYEDADQAIAEIEEMLKHKKAAALGEIGLDYHYEDIPKELQMIYFEKQMALAERLNIPVIIHDRDAHGDCIDMIRKFPSVKGVFHSFSGSPEMAKELLKRGWYLGFDGPITYKNARRSPEVVAITPLDRIVIATDAPYLTTVPYRG